MVIISFGGISPDEAKAKENPFFDLCNKTSDDFLTLEFSVKKAFPIGSSSTKLENAINASQGFTRLLHRKKVPEYLYGPEFKSFASFYSQNCALEHENINLYYISFLINQKDEISALAFDLFFEDENFEKRAVDFKSRNFRGSRPAKRALWDITGVGTPRAKVHEIMNGSGITSHHVSKRKDVPTAVVYRKKFDDQNISLRMGVPIGMTFVWEFDHEDKLIDIAGRKNNSRR